MRSFHLSWLILVLLTGFSSALAASPLAPDEIRVADSPVGGGQICGLGEGVGISQHPYFSVVSRCAAPKRAATKLRVQLALDPLFSVLLWDSGFVAIDATGPDQRTPYIAYNGAPLPLGAPIYVRAGVKDDQDAASPFSTVLPNGATPQFSVATPAGACDLRVGTDISSEKQGNPAVLPSHKLRFTAEYVGAELQANQAQVEISMASDFQEILWDSGWVTIAAISSGQRCQPILTEGDFDASTAYFWRIRFKDTTAAISSWNAAGASFVVQYPDPTQPAPAGFGGAKRDIGIFGTQSSDIAVDDLNVDGIPDVVIASEVAGEPFTLQLSFGALNQGAVLYFGAALGGKTRLACLDVDQDGDRDVAVLAGHTLTIYLNSSLTFVPLDPIEISGNGELLELHAADLEWSGWPGLVASYQDTVYWLPNDNGLFESVVEVSTMAAPVLDVSVADFLDDGRPEIVVMREGLVLAFGVFKGYVNDLGVWPFAGANQFKVVAGNGDVAKDILCTNGWQVEIRRLNEQGEWSVLKQAALAHGGMCLELLSGDLNGDGLIDAAALMDTGSLLCMQTATGFAEHEYAGYGLEGAHARGSIADVNDDGRLDIVATRPGATTQVYYNGARRQVSISNAAAVQPAYGEGYIEFEISLDAPSCSYIEVDCATDEEGEGEGDRVPNDTSFLNAQAGPGPLISTSGRLVFVPGQMRAMFRVALSKATLPQVSTGQVHIVGALGALMTTSTATGTVYAAGGSSSGPAAQSGIQRDWTLRGQVNAMVHAANGNVYFGGEFDGVEWQANGLAALDASGLRQRALPGVNGTVKAVAMDTDGSVYIGGQFVLTHLGLTYKNVVKFNYDGSLDTGFRPNPNTATGDGVVNAIALKNGSVYLGGRFTQLANCTLAIKNIAHVFSTGAYPARPDRFGVYKSFTPPGDPQQLPPEVLCLLVADGGFGSQEFLIVGGKRFDRAISTTGGSVVVGNLALFGTGYGSPVANMPRVSGEVRALAVSNEMFSNWGTGGYSRTILFGGSFEWVFYPKMGATVYETRMNLNSTNFSGELKYGKSTSALSNSPVHALHVESGNKLWVGRDKQHLGNSYDPLSIYSVTSGDFVRNTSFASGLNSAVRGLALGENQLLVTGDFTQRTVGASSIPVGRALVFSTQTLGVVSSFRASVDQPIVCVASARDAQNRLRGFILGGSFTKLIALRGNLAAMNAAGELLPWGPSVDGPVHGMALDGGTVFFGGEFTQVTGTQINARRSLACTIANDEAVDAANWMADLSGSTCEVRALVIDGSALVIGGDFTAVNGMSREDAAAVDKTNAAVTSWTPDLAHDAASKVYALLIDGNNLYIGGSFSGTVGVARPGLLAVTKPSLGPISLLAWDAAIASPCTVRAIGASTDDVFFVGQFATVGAQARNGAAAVTKSNAAPTSFAPVINGNAHALAVLPSGAAYVGGDFSTVSGQTRKGVAALDAAGNVLTWDASVLGIASGESVRALSLVDTAQASQLWLAGKFTGTPHVGQRHLTWFSRAWSITTPTLPNANEDQPYGPVTVGLSEPIACNWSIYAPAASWLQISTTGEISGPCPLGAPALIPVRITATQTANPGIFADRWYMLAVTPKPPPTLISISGPASVNEGDDPILEPAPVVTIALNQLFGADVEIEIQYIDVGAANGRDYAAVVRHAKINAGYWTVDVPLCIFGDTITGAPTREFIVRIVSQTANVSASAAADQLSVTIQEDDPAQPSHAVVHSLHVCESATAPADPAHVVSNQPLFKWSFRSDFAGDAQTGWQVQVYDNSTFTGTAIWDSGAQIGTETEILLGAIGGAATLIDGQNYFARARLWSSPTEVSAWRTLAFHTNTPPPAVLHSSLTPSGNVFTSRPTLTWDISPDAESDPLNFKVTLSGASTIEFDSVVQPWIFERLNATTSAWEPFGQAGVGAGYSKVRVTVPMGSALAAGQWSWTVIVNDGFESTAVAAPTNVTINVQPAYAASGRVRDAALHPDAGRTVSVYHMPSHTLLGSNFTNANGDFIIPLGGTPQPGDILAVVIDNPASPPPSYTPAYAAAFIRFSGNDLVQVSGPDRGIELVHGRVTIDPRGLDTLTLASLLDGTGGDPDWPFAVNGSQLVLRDEMSGIDIEGALAVLGTSAAPSEPTTLSLPGTVQAQQIKTVNGGALLIQGGAHVSATSLVNDGCVSIETGGEMRLRAPSTTSGQFVMQQGSLLELNLAQLTITAGYPQWQSANVHGVNGSEVVAVQGGSLSASGTTFNGVTLDVGASGDVTDLVGAIFTGPALDHRIGWSRQRAIGTSLRSIRFDAGATYNVAATAGADTLTLYGCGGDLAGEASDLDPGEATSQDIVLWVLSSLQECRAIAGDTRVLLLWNAGAQGGTGFTYNIYTTPAPGGQVTQIGTTQNSYYVDSGLTNGAARYYYIELSAWGTHSTWSTLLECTPQPPALEEAYPIALRQSGTAPGIAEGSATHFKSSTSITSPQTGITIPAASIDIISETLILFEVETNAAALGQATIEITTPDVWIEHGYTGYSETVTFQAEVKPPATPNYPSVVFVQTGGAVGPDALTDGAFTVAVEFNKEGGADIEPQSFECVVNRDIMVGGQIVAAGTNLAGPQFGLWGTPTATGATWQVDQIQVTTEPQEEFISRGELVISVRVSNAFGYTTPWHPMRIHVEGGDPDFAITEGTLEPGKTNQLLTIRAGCLQNTTYELAFPQGSGITVQSVTTNSSSGIALEVIVNAATESPIGSDTYDVVQASTQQIVATGTYRTAYKYANLYSAAGSGAGPRAVTAAVGVILKTGEFTWSDTDLVTKARKFPIVWSRTYRSGRSERRDTPLGKGWYSPYFQKVEVGFNSLRWQTATGDFVDFDNPQIKDGKYEWRCPPGYNVLAKTKDESSIHECDIQTSDGLTYRFSRGWGQLETLLLREIVDSNLNRQVLEYDDDDEHLLVIRGDTYDFTGSTSDFGVAECLRLTYYKHGVDLIKTVTRVRSVKDQADSAPLDRIRYYYTAGERLALQRVPDSDRFNERSYRGYFYEQGLLRKLFTPSRTVTSPNPITPSSNDNDEEWNCVAVGDGTSVPISALTVMYDQSGRVESQVLGPIGGPKERRYTIAHGSGSTSNERTVTPPSGSASDVKYVLNDDGQATSITQYAPAVTGPGSSVFMTAFEYEAYTQNLLKVTQPAGNSTYFSYTPGKPKSGGSGNFISLNLPSGSTTTELGLQMPGSGSPSWVGCMAKIQQLGPSGMRKRYYVVAQGTTTGILVLGANLLNDGFVAGIPGTFVVYDANGNPLSRSLLIQERRCEGSGWATSDLVTTYVRVDSTRNGYYYSNLTQVIDPWGRRTVTKHTHMQVYLPADERSDERITTKCSVATAKDAQGDNPSSYIQVTHDCYDKFGRLETSLSPERSDRFPSTGKFDENSAISYYYAAVGRSVTPDVGTYSGQLCFSITRRTGSSEHGPSSATTDYTYDARGSISKVRQPRGESPIPYAAAAFESTIVTNAAGQVIHVTGPASGPAGSCKTSETWYFYDKDGRVVHQCEKFVPVGQSNPTQTGNGSEQNENAIIAAFARPQLIAVGGSGSNDKFIGSGWIHTRYEYNDWGELEKEIQDFDLDSAGNVIVAQTDFEYDLEGRQTVVNDPRGRITRSQHEPRGLRSVTFASGTAEQSAVEYRYDNNGNLNWEMIGSAPGTTYPMNMHEYDGFNRRIQSTHFHGAGGVWSELFEYPKPSGPLETGSYLAIGAGSNLTKARGSKSLEDGAGRVYRNWTIAQNKSGSALDGAVKDGTLHWAVSASELDARGMPIHSWVRLGEGWMPPVAHNTLDGRGTLVKAFGPSTNEDGEHISYFYDAAGNTVKTITPVVGTDQMIASSIAEVVYDPGNQPWKTTLKWQDFNQTSPETVSTTTIERNNLGWPERVVDGAGRETRTDYNLVGLPRRSVVFENTGAKGVTEREYYRDGTLFKETAYRSVSGSPFAGTKQETIYEYDAKRRVTKITRPGNLSWLYTYTLTDQVKTERRSDGTVITNDYDLVGNLTSRSITSPGGNSTETETYTYGPFDEIKEATTKNAAGKPTTKLEMEYNSLGQIERQVLTVYDDQGQALSPYFVEHNLDSSQIGFTSLYKSTTLGFSSFEMKAQYDCLGREIQQEFWDKRKVKSEWCAVLPFRLVDNTFEDGILLAQFFSYEDSILYGREFHMGTFNELFHVRSMRPSREGRKVPLAEDVKSATTLFAFGPQGGLAEVKHSHAKLAAGGVTHGNFAHIQSRYDGAGNPVLDRAVHRGGLSRVAKYDHSTRLKKSFHGHLISMNTPALILSPLDANLNPTEAQWERTYTQDTLDNITGISDVVGADTTSRTTTSVSIPVVSDTENLIKSIGASGLFNYDTCKSLETDPTTGLTYKYNHRGQLIEVVNGSGTSAVTVRRCIYDCFGRMVHQIEAPGTTAERGTIFIPNVGFGGGGEGADLAAEITYERDGTVIRGREVVQYTYGIGAVGGGLGRKRLVEFVAYCAEFAPYYRFLHEDTQGNTIATTSLWGDRLDEYDYTDYGVPLHAPVALDGRWIASVASGAADISTVTLGNSDMLVPNELLGCELRVAMEDAATAKTVFLAGTVISHLGAAVKIHDPGHKIATAWNNTTGVGRVHRPSACFYDLREGYYRGVIDSATPGTWLGQQVTFLTVNAGAFETWMVSWGGSGPDVFVQLGSQSAKVIGADQPADAQNFPNGGFKRLILQGQGYTGAAAGQWYTIIGNCTTEDIARCGSWSAPASHIGGATTFVLSPFAEVRDEQIGWWLQPNINCQAWFPIIAVSESAHTVTVAGNHAALGAQGTRFRIHAPPGVQTRGPRAGLLPMFAEAASSRCLYKGYRYEAPASGRWDDVAKAVAARQGGSNFTGQHYTLFRHFDPSLMRFTSLDPIAASQNLWAYCDNNPHGAYDPDGLDAVDDAISFLRWRAGGAGQNAGVEYLYRLKGAIDGAAFDIADYATFKQKFTDDDREAMQWKYDRDGRGDAYKWGGVVGGGTYVAVATLATGGYVGGQLAAGFAFYGGSAYVGGLAITGNALAWGIGGWVGGEVGTRMMHGRGQTNTEAAISFGFGAALGGIGQYYSAPRPMVPSAAPKQYRAQFGWEPNSDYTEVFFQTHPELRGQVWVHHAVEQQAATRFPGVVAVEEIQSLQNLRGIPKPLNAKLHLSILRKEWNQFYRSHPTPSKEQLLEKATELDLKYGHQFAPPVGNK